MNRIDGKIARVTGGTQGLGAAIARLFVTAGAAGVAIVGRDQSKGDALASEITSDSGVPVQMITAFLGEMTDVMRVVATAEARFGRIDILVRIAPRFVDALLGNFGSKERHEMGNQDRFTDEFKRDAVAQVVDRGYPVREVAERLGISTKSIYTWQRLFSRPVKVIQEVDAQADEIRRLKRDLARVTSGRDILK